MGVCKKIKRRADQERNVWELFRMFKNEKKILGLSKSTLQNYEDSLKRFMDYMECTDAPIQEIDYDDVLSFTQGLQEEELSVSSINHYLRDIRAFFNWCSKSGYCRKIEVKLVKGQETVKETYSEEELKALLEKPQGDSYCEWRCWAIINWILATGNREKTVCNVRMRDINLPDEEIVLQQTKNKKIQIIPMSTELSFVLTQFIRDFRSEADDDEFLFCNVSGEQLTENALKLSIRDYNAARGVKKTSVHALRHTFAKLWIEYAAEQGHKVIVMTGTPEPVQSYFRNNGWHIEDYRKICNYVKPEAIKYIYKEKRVDVIKEALEENKKVISDTAKSMKNDDGSLIDEKFKDTVASADAVVQKYLNSTDSTTATSDKMNNIFALSQFSDLKDKLIAAGKSGGTDAIKKMIKDTDGLGTAMNNAGLTADDLAASIMSIADPDAKNLEGIKENLEDIFGKDGLGQSDFFKGKTDEELENFWDYLQDNNYNPKQMNWNEETTKKNFEAAQEAKKKTPEESATFASKFKNAAEDTATDIDTVTDNFQSDMKNIQSAMESVTNGTFQNSDMADLIQQFPELSNASGDLKDNLQNLAMNKGAEAIGKIRDSVKDVTDPKQLAQADKYVQSIMDTMGQD